MDRWFVLHTKHHKERLVASELHAEKLDCYLPLLSVNPVNPRAAREQPYFPGYLFVRKNEDDIGVNCLRWLPGTRGVVQFGGEPATVSDSLILTLKCRLATMNTERETNPKNLNRGDKVRIEQDQLTGYEVIFDEYLPGQERARVLLGVLEKGAVKVRLDINDIGMI